LFSLSLFGLDPRKITVGGQLPPPFFDRPLCFAASVTLFSSGRQVKDATFILPPCPPSSLFPLFLLTSSCHLLEKIVRLTATFPHRFFRFPRLVEKCPIVLWAVPSFPPDDLPPLVGFAVGGPKFFGLTPFGFSDFSFGIIRRFSFSNISLPPLFVVCCFSSQRSRRSTERMDFLYFFLKNFRHLVLFFLPRKFGLPLFF